MSLDQDLKNAFERHARDAQPDDEAWQTVERRIRRAHIRRVTVASALSVALIVVAAVLVPRIGTRPESRGFTNPTVSPTTQASPSGSSSTSPSVSATPSQAPAIPAGWQRRAGVQSGFQLGIPSDWKGGWFEGVWDFEPRGLPGGAMDGDTFLVTITPTNGSNISIAAPPDATTVEINGRRAQTWSEGSTEIDYVISWTFCPGYAASCSVDSEINFLTVRVRATNATLWSQYKRMGQQIVTTIAPYDGGTPIYGDRSPYVPMNEFTRALTRFMDARVEGIGADELACCNAATYLSKNNEFYLVAGQPITSYLIRTGDKLSSGGYGYIVEWYDANKSGEVAEVTVDYHSSAQPMIVDIGSPGGRPVPCCATPS